MKVFLIILIIVVMFIIYRKRMRNIDEEEKIALSTPRRANYLRDNFHDLVAGLESLPGYRIEFERADLIRFVNDNGRIVKKIIIQQWTPDIMVVHTIDNAPLKEWKFNCNSMSGQKMLDVIKRDLNI